MRRWIAMGVMLACAARAEPRKEAPKRCVRLPTEPDKCWMQESVFLKMCADDASKSIYPVARFNVCVQTMLDNLR